MHHYCGSRLPNPSELGHQPGLQLRTVKVLGVEHRPRHASRSRLPKVGFARDVPAMAVETVPHSPKLAVNWFSL